MLADFQTERLFADIFKDALQKINNPPYPGLYITEMRTQGVVHSLFYYNPKSGAYEVYEHAGTKDIPWRPTTDRANYGDKGAFDNVKSYGTNVRKFRSEIKAAMRNGNMEYGWWDPVTQQTSDAFPLRLIRFFPDPGYEPIAPPAQRFRPLGGSGLECQDDKVDALWIILFIIAAAGFLMCCQQKNY